MLFLVSIYHIKCDGRCCLQLMTNFLMFGVNVDVAMLKTAVECSSVIRTLKIDFFNFIK